MRTSFSRFALVDDDSGTTLTELIVGMMVMGIFMTIFTGAVVSMANTATKVEAITSSASQVNNAFLGLDKLVRYSTAVGTPGTGSGGDWYVELESVSYGSPVEVRQCTQLWVDTSGRRLRARTWIPPTAPATDYQLSAWSTLANNVTNGSASATSSDAPFTVPAQLNAATTSYQRLTVTLVAGTSGPSSPTTSRASATFTALNSAAVDSTNAAKCLRPGSAVYRP